MVTFLKVIFSVALATGLVASQNCSLPSNLSLLGSYLTALDISLDQLQNATVFAPTNTAFNTLLSGLSLSNDSATWSSTQKLIVSGAIFYHVLQADVRAADVPTTATSLPTVFAVANTSICPNAINNITALRAGSNVTIRDATGGIASVIQANIEDTTCLRPGRTTIIHIIDKVLIPCPVPLNLCAKDVYDTVLELNTTSPGGYLIAPLLRLLQTAGPTGTKSVFVPTTAAVSAALAAIQQYTRLPALPANITDTPPLNDVYLLHVASDRATGNVTVDTLYETDSASQFCRTGTPQSGVVTIDEFGTGAALAATITDYVGQEANVTEFKTEACDGVVYVIDTVLLPCALQNSFADALLTCNGTGDELAYLAQTAADNTANISLILTTALQYGLIKPDMHNLTIFAPTDAAVLATLTDLGIPGNATLRTRQQNLTLIEVIKHHILPTYVRAGDISNAGSVSANTLVDTAFCPNATSVLTARFNTTGVFVNTSATTAQVVGPDLDTRCLERDHFVIVHAIDRVLVPCPDITKAATLTLNCSGTGVELANLARVTAGNNTANISLVLTTALQYGLIPESLTGATIFAPTDAAIIATLGVLGIPATPSNRTLVQNMTLMEVIKHHVVPAYVRAEDIIQAGNVDATSLVNTTFCPGTSSTLRASRNATGVFISAVGSTAQVVGANLETPCLQLDRDVVVHAISTVLVPCPDIFKAFSPPALPPASIPPPPPPACGSIPAELTSVATAAAAQNTSFSLILTTAVQYGLVPADLKNATIFAPTDAVLLSTLGALGIPANATLRTRQQNLTLIEVIRAHIVPSYVKAADIVAAGRVIASTLVNPDFCPNATSILTASSNTTGVFITMSASGAQVVAADEDNTCLQRSSVVVHAINRVLVPCPDILKAVTLTLNCSGTSNELANLAKVTTTANISLVLTTALQYGLIPDSLTGATIFAPSDAAIVAVLGALSIPTTPSQRSVGQNLTLKEVIKHHVVPQYIKAADIVAARSVNATTLVDTSFCPNAPGKLTASVNSTGVFVTTPGVAGGAQVVAANLETPCLELDRNVVVHAISSVLVPCPDITKAVTLIPPPPPAPSPPPSAASTAVVHVAVSLLSAAVALIALGGWMS